VIDINIHNLIKLPDYVSFKRLFWTCTLIFIQLSALSSDTILITKDANYVFINGKEKYFFSESHLPIQEVIKKEFIPKENVNTLYITGWLWVKFVFKNNSNNEHFVFNVSDGHISGFYLYKPVGKSYVMTPPKRYHSEDGREMRNRLPAFYIDLKRGSTQTFYLKVNCENEVMNFDYIIQDYPNYIKSTEIDQLIIALYLGALIIIICINIFYFYSLKDFIFLIYSLYVFGNILLTVTLDGYIWLLVPDPNIAYHINFLCIRFWNDSLLFFIMHLVNLKKNSRALNILGYLYLIYHSILLAIVQLLNLFNVREYFMAQWEGINWMISLVLGLIIIVRSKNENRYLLKYYFVVFIILISAFSLYIILHLNKGGHYLLFEHGMKATALLEILTLSFAVSRRFKLTEQDLKRKQEEEQQLTEQVKQLEMDVRKAQMNPHFMFNALTSIEHFIMKNNSALACDYLEKFAQLMRLTLDHSRNEYVYLQDDLRALQYYVELEFLRLKDQAHQFELDVDKNIDPEELAVPALLIQPFVENAIWHGLQKKETPGKLSVKLRLIGEQLICTIEDNGGGILANVMKRKSSGITITKERLTLIHVLLKTDYQFDIGSATDEAGHMTGTRVQFTMPYIRD